jgi:hypothetical protein
MKKTVSLSFLAGGVSLDAGGRHQFRFVPFGYFTLSQNIDLYHAVNLEH